MKYILIFFTALSLTSCSAQESQNRHDGINIPKTNFSLQLPTSAHIKILQENADTYKDGMRLFITSHSDEEFQKLAKENLLDSYFSFWIYEEAYWNSTVNDWTRKNCLNEAGIKKMYEKDGLKIIQTEQPCFSEAIFAIFENRNVYKIQASPDTSNPDQIWDILKTIQPAKS